MTVVVGRRRIGKTRLILESLKGERYLYFFVARKDEKLLCEEYVEQIRETLGINVFGEISRFKDIFELLLSQAEREPLTLVIDEFQEFNRINSAIFSEMQSAWDRKKDRTKMNLIVSGSVHSMMKKYSKTISSISGFGLFTKTKELSRSAISSTSNRSLGEISQLTAAGFWKNISSKS